MSRIDFIPDVFENQSTLLLIPSNKYNDIRPLILKQLNNQKICYVTLNKTYDSLIELFERENVNKDNIVFIDAITKSVNKVENIDDCYFVSSPHALTELSIVITEFLQHNFDYIIFDSLTTLQIYQRAAEPIIRFATNMVNKIKTHDCKCIFYALNINEHKMLIDETSTIMDKIINFEEEKII